MDDNYDLEFEFEFKLNQFDNEIRPFLVKYQRFVVEESTICIQQTFRKYQLQFKKISNSNDRLINDNEECIKENNSISIHTTDRIDQTDNDIIDDALECNKNIPLNNCSKINSNGDCCLNLAEGSFKNELLNCSMDIDIDEMCPRKDEHPFQSNEIKSKRMETLSAKR